MNDEATCERCGAEIFLYIWQDEPIIYFCSSCYQAETYAFDESP